MFKLEDNKSYRMPAHFGGDDPPAPDFAVYIRDLIALQYTCTADGDQLANYVPESFELLRPEVMFTFTQMRECDWLAGGGYNTISADVPVCFTGKRDRLEGNYNLVTWENLTAPIIGGREENGVPKIYADIQNLHAHPADYLCAPDFFTNASYDGNTFVRMTMSNATPIEGDQLAALQAAPATVNLFGWRYIPKVSGRGAELSQFILYPQGSEVKSAWVGSGTVEWIKLRPEQNPSQFHIINALAELPIIEMAPVLMTRGIGFLKPSQGRVLE
ncbi:MAG: acetoacetate decarboxylase family protein [Halobacteriota archaeon]